MGRGAPADGADAPEALKVRAEVARDPVSSPALSIEVVSAAPSTPRAPLLPAADADERDAAPPPRARRRGEVDTLLSVPAPAETVEVEIEERVRTLEMRLSELEARLGRFSAEFAAAGAGRHGWAPWLIVLLLLVVVGHLLVRLGAR